jgi:hypothetical protein
MRLILCGAKWFCAAMLCTAACPALAEAQEAAPARREFTAPVPLLGADGKLEAWGWARRALMQYNRDAIPAERRPRIKEWEHFTIMSPQFTVGMTIVQLGSIVVGSAELIDYPAESIRHGMFLIPAPKDRVVLPPNPYGQTRLAKGDNFVSMAFDDGTRTLACKIGKTNPMSAAFEGEFHLRDPRDQESVAITRPFAGEGEFFYENKIFGLPASGAMTVDGQTYELPTGEAWAIFDWGRGIWPHDSQWFWGQASGKADGKPVAINLGHGYGDDSRGTCNAILVDGKLHKLDVVDCQFDVDDRMQPWTFSSNDKRLTLDFRPIYQQHSKQDAGFAKAELFKIHGRYSGTLVLDDGTKLEIRDLLGFAEHMQQRW